ncbi:serine O-acetyltransferase [Frigoriglobus tundricola]|uniref:Serine acetyltransferase n=1 Tax=Frigoriglobus tundricola TaxID=2774151 RepID=A0A6M5YXG2_9BACT|nr:serine O-acetyltransferase [Frigoriglobus tundricola]QJW98066.1 Serine acetyltransferase [Frigoriglobus tundricola]
MFSAIRQDVHRCGRSAPARLREVLFNPSMWAVFGYRLRRWVAVTLPRPLRWALAPVVMPLQLGLDVLTMVQLPTAARIGPGLYLPHLGAIVVGSGCVVGRNCTIAHNVTIGHAGGRSRSGAGNPVIGDRVYIGPGAILIGPITVGDDALIGAGAVVVKSVPPGGVAVGNPARLIGRSGSFDLIEYPGMETDPARTAAHAAAAEPLSEGSR